MAGTLPTVRGTAQALYPVTRRIEFLTDVAIALNYTEQRSKLRPPLTRFVFPYSRMTATDMASVRSFLESQKGQFDTSWSVTLGATTYNHLTLEDSVFEVLEQAETKTTYGFTLRCRQTQNPGQTAGSPGGTFPTLSAGVTCQLPYTQIRRYSVLLNDNPTSGNRYTWTWFGGGLSGFPTGSLHGWTLAYQVLSDADLATLETFYRNQWGRWSSFTFVDPETNISYSKCRFDDDALEISHQQPNVSSLTLKILETN
jgi:hypothetical protein